MNTYFSNIPVNIGRQIELDLARGLAVVFMVFVHVQEYFLSPKAYTSFSPEIIDILGEVPAAPVFMFLLGVGINYSNKTAPAQLFRRGIMLVLVGYLLSILRGVVPYTILWFKSGNSEMLNNAVSNLLFIDILQFAGLALLFFGLVIYYKINHVILIALGLLFALINQQLCPIQFDSKIPAALSGLIWGSSKISFFPFLTWIFYPIAGYVWGWYQIRSLNKSIFYLYCFGTALLIMLAGLLYKPQIINLNDYSDFYYYHHHLPENIVFTSFVLVWIHILYHLSKVLPNKALTFINRWSRNVTSIYLAQWIIIGWLILFIKSQDLSFTQCLLLSSATFFASDLIATYHNRLMRNRQKQNR